MTRNHHRRALGSVLAVAALACAGTAYADSPDSSHASQSREKTIRLIEASETLQPTFVDTGKPGLSPGDLVVTRDGVLHEDGTPAGTLRQVCTLVDATSSPFTSTFECAGSIALEDGTITMQGPFVPAEPEQSAAVTGGTGGYATARGEVIVRSEADQILVKLAR